ncbi:hypothetical protein KL935_004880 [Ogataea polymorpha]|uniref:uncharacterized protein n=1 Tax=Ogataea polymorpha TaxID=460523 RepID=UPI0007F33F67|nr:uncharacterized protein OGAPODRAFT_91647 [Ogataea polymorpha]KAG7877221.1 hypothetical protein KL937_004912 [Ogataea polymorpha]KAG7894317.1 hypothetical protein KL908_001689 [Ogataea polymorpha]KAG7897699.1 hypothetical protein KL935_004880 [Ogataea polymorpha]KAG7910175.1 hypothetical protein KL906_002080 [Ogataea polymorpha]KAG7930306.1 hypothetical protein KL934_005000 [Ogataea polymorpha]
MWTYARRGYSNVASGVASINALKSPAIRELQQLAGTDSQYSFPTPRQLKAHLDKYIIGQDHCKKVLSVAVFNHYIRVQDASNDSSSTLLGAPVLHKKSDTSVELEKSNILLFGPTGSGKTLAATTMARVLQVPIVIQDCTSLTQAGYVGEDVESCILKLLTKADFDVNLCQRGIVVLDELDKLAKPQVYAGTKDIGGEGVQQALLKLVEGTSVSVHAKKSNHMENTGLGGGTAEYTVDTSTILFIGMGAFTGLDKIIKKRLGRKKLSDVLSKAQPSDLEQYGLIPELVGRMPVFSSLKQLEVDDLERILVEPQNSIVRQYEYSFAKSGVRLAFTRTAVRKIAEKALENGTGARGLRGVLEKVLLAANYECPGSGISFVLVDEEVMEMDEITPKYFARGEIFRFLEQVGKEDEQLRGMLSHEYGIPKLESIKN